MIPARPTNENRRVYSLPIPPSVNRLYANAPGAGEGHKGRRKTAAYRDWLQLAQADLLQARADVSPVPPPYGIRITLNIDRRSDLDNRAKAILDLLQSLGVLADDRQVDQLLLERKRSLPDLPARRCWVTVRTLL